MNKKAEALTTTPNQLPKKKYDIFVSYSHLNEIVVNKIVDALRQRDIKVWHDGSEMKPGDVLRERINQGIEQANNFLIIVSEDSLNSPWVQYELNSAVIREIEQKHVRVIPAIIGKMEFKQLPSDLSAKYSLDFRSKKYFEQSINALVDLIQPEKRQRKELLVRLKNQTRNDDLAIRELKEYALRSKDQAIQIAAMYGLEKIGGPEAVLTIAERVQDTFGIRGINRAIKGLANLANDGGLLALIATLPCDYRFYREKVEAFSKAAKGMKKQDLSELAEIVRKQISALPLAAEIPLEILKTFEGASNDDIRNGAILARLVRTIPPQPKEINNDIVERAIGYSDKRIPGLVSLIRSHLNNQSPFRQ